MIRAGLILLAILVVMTGFARASEDQKVVAGLSQHSVSLTTGFSGSELFIYGAIKLKGPYAEDDTPLGVIVTVAGPSSPLKVRRKVRRTGIWVNGDAVTIDSAPSFYAIASSDSLDDLLTPYEQRKFRIGLEQVIRISDALTDQELPEGVTSIEEYRTAVARIRANEGLYRIQPNTVKVVENVLFETRISLPANLVEGDHYARIFLVRDGRVLDVFADRIEVRRAGLGRMIYSSAQDYPALYGIVSILVALIAGWLASAFFRTFFPN